MPNPKITISLDQSILDAFAAHAEAMDKATAALEHLSEVLKSVGADTPSVTDTEKPAEPTPVVEASAAPVAPVVSVQTAPIPAPSMNGFDFTASAAQAQSVQTAAMPTAAPVAPAAPAAATQMPTSGVAPLTLEQIAMAGGQLMSLGVNANALLPEFGVTRLSDLPPEKYPEMAARMRQLGAKI